MVTALITKFLQAKMRDAKTSVALYSVSSDVDGAKIVQQTGVRSNKAIVRMLESTCDPLATDPQLVASMLQGIIVGISRRMLESGVAEKQLDALRRELIFMACAYVDACSARFPVQGLDAIGEADEEPSDEIPHVVKKETTGKPKLAAHR
jgi:hypothetical protein